MGFRATLATLILLLSVSCVASACEASCDLKVLGAGCHHAGATASGGNHLLEHAQAGMSRMHDCGMNVAESPAKSPACSMVDASPCEHSVCEQQPQALARDKKAGETGQSTIQLAAIIVALAFPMPEQVSRRQASKPPLFRAPLLISLQTLIRV